MGNAKEWKWGYITPAGDFAIPPVFDDASGFHDGMAAVKVDWARGYIDRSGAFVIDPVFEAAGDFCDGFATVRLNGEIRRIDRKGDFKNNDSISAPPAPIIESGYNPRYELHDGLVRFVENEKFGYKDKDGNVVIKAQFFEAADFSEGLACVKKGKTSPWAYIDTTGRVIIPALFRQAQPFHEGLAAVLTAVEPTGQ